MYGVMIAIIKWVLIGYVTGAVGWFLYVVLTPDGKFSTWQSRVPFALIMAILWPWLSISIPLHERKIKSGYYDKQRND